MKGVFILMAIFLITCNLSKKIETRNENIIEFGLFFREKNIPMQRMASAFLVEKEKKYVNKLYINDILTCFGNPSYIDTSGVTKSLIYITLQGEDEVIEGLSFDFDISGKLLNISFCDL